MNEKAAEDKASGMRDWLRKGLSPQVLIPAIVGLGMLAYVASLANSRAHSSNLWLVLQQTWLVVLLLTFPYLIARALVWYRLMRQLGIKVPWPQAAISFAGGEITKDLPAGVYLENYILGRLVHFNRHSFIRSTMATTAMLGLEALLAFPIAMIFGLPGEPWLFWLLVGVVAGWVTLLVAAWTLVHYYAHRAPGDKKGLIHQTVTVVDEFLHAGRELLTWQTLVGCIPTAVYLLVYVVDLYAILLALKVHIGFVHVMGIYALIVLAVILIPIPTGLGITELTGVGALLAYGVPGNVAALAMLSLRILASGMIVTIACAVIVALRRELQPLERKGQSSMAEGVSGG